MRDRLGKKKQQSNGRQRWKTDTIWILLFVPVYVSEFNTNTCNCQSVKTKRVNDTCAVMCIFPSSLCCFYSINQEKGEARIFNSLNAYKSEKLKFYQFLDKKSVLRFLTLVFDKTDFATTNTYHSNGLFLTFDCCKWIQTSPLQVFIENSLFS